MLVWWKQFLSIYICNFKKKIIRHVYKPWTFWENWGVLDVRGWLEAPTSNWLVIDGCVVGNQSTYKWQFEWVNLL